MNYLWDLDIEQIPLGWQSEFDRAIKELPDGELTTMPDLSDPSATEIGLTRHEYNPIKYRDTIVKLFNEQKSLAHDVLKNEQSMKALFNRLLKIDINLFNLLNEWLYSSDLYQLNSFEPKHLLDLIESNLSSDYFDAVDIDTIPKKYVDLRLITLFDDSSEF